MRSAFKNVGLWLLITVFCGVFLIAAKSKNFAKDLWLMLPSGDTEECSFYRLSSPYTQFYGEEGLSIAMLEDFSGKPIWKQDPHTEESLNGESDDDRYGFGHYNPTFVKWAFNTLIPAKRDSKFRRKTQSRYDACLAGIARPMWLVNRIYQSEKNCRKRMHDEINTTSARDFDFNWDECASKDLNETVHYFAFNAADKADIEISIDRMLLFWFRRDMDGSFTQFEAGLNTLLKTYDAAWLKTAMKKSPEVRPFASALIKTDSNDTESQQAKSRIRYLSFQSKHARLKAKAQKAFKKCAGFKTELTAKKSFLMNLKNQGWPGAYEGGLSDLQEWIESEQSDEQGLGAALEELQSIMEALTTAQEKGLIKEGVVIQFARDTQFHCGE